MTNENCPSPLPSPPPCRGRGVSGKRAYFLWHEKKFANPSGGGQSLVSQPNQAFANGRRPAKLAGTEFGFMKQSGNGSGAKTLPMPKLQDQNKTSAITRELRIDKVGVRGLRFPIQIRDKARVTQNTIATIGMYVDLPKEFKGTHMSRFIEVLNAHGNMVHVENITDILHAMQKKLHQRTAHLEMEFPFS